MKITKLASYLIFSGLFVSSTFTYAIDNNKPIVPPPEKLTEHVYAWIGPLDGPSKENQGYRMNMVFVVGNTAVAVIDTGYTEAMAEEMLSHIKKITNLPVKYAINTNSQPDRFMGNPVFRRAGAEIIAHQKSAQRMEKQISNYVTAIENILELKPGTVTIPKKPDRIIKDDTELKLDLGGLTITLQNFGPAHTPAQLVIGIAADNIVYTGDLLYSGRLLAVLADSNVKHWLAAFDRLKQFDDALFVPGHGQPAKLDAFEFPTHQYLNLLYEHMKKMVDEGVDIQDAINQLDQSRFSKLAHFDDLAGRNASWTYLELEAASFE